MKYYRSKVYRVTRFTRVKDVAGQCLLLIAGGTLHVLPTFAGLAAMVFCVYTMAVGFGFLPLIGLK